MKVCLEHETRLMPLYHDHKGDYTLYRGKRVYVMESRGTYYPLD